MRGTRWFLILAILAILAGIGATYRLQRKILLSQAAPKPAKMPAELKSSAEDWVWTQTENGKVTGVQTTRGRIKTGMVINQTAGFCTLISDMVGVRLPITSHQLQACVTEALKPFLDVVIVSGSLHVYVSQADRGELVMGASIDPYTSYSYDSTLGFLENLCQHMLELFPFLSRVKILRQWAGVCDMTPDFSPIMGFTPVDGFIVDVGWGTYGFKAGPVSGKRMAELIATQKTPDLLAPFRLSRFEEGGLMGEKGAASVGH